MKAQEKAIELVNKFGTVGLQQREEGIQCALIAVDEIINTGLLLDSSIYVTVKTSLDYWQQVKQEIEKL
jgi:hypothetical protein